MKLQTNKKGNLVVVDSFESENTIHVFHCSKDIEDLKEDIWSTYLVAEECTNFARTHLLTASSEDDALQAIDQYLREDEGEDESHLIGVFKLEI
jgi:hypothetical protein